MQFYFIQKNLTRNFQEYYDYNGNRAAILSYDKKTGHVMRSIIDIEKKEASIIMPSKWNKRTGNTMQLFIVAGMLFCGFSFLRHF